MTDKNNETLTYDTIIKDIDSYTKKSFLLTFLSWFSILSSIWTVFIVIMFTLIWNFEAILNFTKTGEDYDCNVIFSGFWDISSINNDTKEIFYKPNSKWWIVIIPILGCIITILSSIGTIIISNHRRYKFKIYYKDFLDNFEISNNYININKSIFKSNLFYFHLFWMIALVVSFVIITVFGMEKPNINFAFNSTDPKNVLKYWTWWYTKEIGENGDISVYIESKPGITMIVFMAIECISVIVIPICNFLYKKYIDNGIIDSIDKITDEYFYYDELEENLN